MSDAVEFVLPLGLEDGKGRVHRRGRMRLATTGDELLLQENERLQFNQRLRDVQLLSQVILRIGELEEIDTLVLENLFEPDFLYLQMLYSYMNSDSDQIARVACPACGEEQRLLLSELYKDYGTTPAEESGSAAIPIADENSPARVEGE